MKNVAAAMFFVAAAAFQIFIVIRSNANMDILKTEIKKLYRTYLIPSLSAAVVTSIYGFIDMIAIGRGVGPDGAAALSIATPIFGVVSFFGILCGVGGSVYLGKARGEGRMEKSSAYFTASLILILVLTILAWVGFFFFSRQIYTFFGATDILMPLVKAYTDWIVWTMPFFMFSSYLSSMVRSDGAPKRVMAAVIIGGMLNIFGDWFSAVRPSRPLGELPSAEARTA